MTERSTRPLPRQLADIFRGSPAKSVAMISVPKGLLRLAALRLLSESSLSGANLREEIVRASKGSWNPGPGSIYFMLRELLKKGLIVELPKRGGGTTRRYVISSKGREELTRLAKESETEVSRQLRLQSFYSFLAGRVDLQKKVEELADTVRGAG